MQPTADREPRGGRREGCESVLGRLAHASVAVSRPISLYFPSHFSCIFPVSFLEISQPSAILVAMAYIARIVDQEIESLLKAAGGIVLDGPKASGKTETGRRHARSELLLDTDPQAEQAMQVDPRLLLDGATPRLLDEWQTYPRLWNHVRRAIDDRRMPGQFILTGSATPADDHTRHSGAGRFASVQMRPMSLTEIDRSTTTISLAALLAGNPGRSPDPGLSLDDLIDAIVRGGWPAHLGVPTTEAARINRDYLDRIRRTDIALVDGVRRDPERLARANFSNVSLNLFTMPGSLLLPI